MAPDPLTYSWDATDGTISGSGATVTYTAPQTEGTNTITVTVSDGQGGSATASVDVQVGAGSGSSSGSSSSGGSGGSGSGSGGGETGSGMGSSGGSTGGSGSGGTSSGSGGVSGGGSSGSAGGSMGSAPATYLAYKASLHLVDPADPLHPIQITPNKILDGFYGLKVTAYDPATGAYEGLHVDAVYYIEDEDGNPDNGGRLMRHPLVKGGNVPVPTQITNQHYCKGKVGGAIFAWDWLQGIVYMDVWGPGTDGQCGTSDDAHYYVHTGMDATQSPIPLNGEEIIDAVGLSLSNLSTTGILVLDGGILKVCDLSLGNCTDLLSGVGQVRSIATNPVNGDEYLCIDGEMWIYDGSVLKDTRSTCDPSWHWNLSDRHGFYVADHANGAVLRYAFDGSGWTTLAGGFSGNFDIEDMTQNYILVTEYSGNANRLWAVPKDGGPPTLLTEFSSTSISGTSWPMHAFGTTLVYAVEDRSGAPQACMWQEGWSAPSCSGSGSYWLWWPVIFTERGTLNVDDGLGLEVYRLLRIEGGTIGPDPLTVTGGRLVSLKPDGTGVMDLGPVPSGYFIHGVDWNSGDTILLYGDKEESPNQIQTDVFFATLTDPGSLTQLTNTPDVTECGVGWRCPSVASPEELDSTQPGVPTDLILTTGIEITKDGNAYSWIKATWTAPSDPDIDEYVVAIREDGSTDEHLFYTPNTYATLAPVKPGVTYWLKVAAIDKQRNQGNWTQEQSIVAAQDKQAPGPPTNVTATTGLDQNLDGVTYAWIEVSWTAPPDTDVVRYELRIKLSGGTTYSYATAFGSPFRFVNVAQGSSYDIGVRAIDASGNASAWAEVLGVVAAQDATPPGDPTNVQVFPGFGVVWITWEQLTDSDFDRVEIWRSTTNDFSKATKIGETQGVSFSDEGVENGTMYYYWLRALDFSGNAGNVVPGLTQGIAVTPLLITSIRPTCRVLAG